MRELAKLSTLPTTRSTAPPLAAPPVRTLQPGWFDDDARADFASRRVLEVARRSDAASSTSAAPSDDLKDGAIRLDGGRLFCPVCSRFFDKQKQLVEHQAGKRHAENVALAAALVAEYASTPWAADGAADAVAAGFSLDLFLAGLPRRSRARGRGRRVGERLPEGARRPTTLSAGSPDGCVDPHVTLSSISLEKRAQLWRHLREATPGSPDLASAFVNLEQSHPRFARLKEVLESVAVYHHAEEAIVRAGGASRVGAVYDVACGHGWVGQMLARRFPELQVHSIDLQRRPAFDALHEAWGKPLPNIAFEAGDLATISPTEGSLVLCTHGCNEVNIVAVDLARGAGAGWMVLPCCLQAAHYLPEASSLKFSDEQRYAVLCGAMAATYGAEKIASLDRRITPRNLVLAGGLKR